MISDTSRQRCYLTSFFKCVHTQVQGSMMLQWLHAHSSEVAIREIYRVVIDAPGHIHSTAARACGPVGDSGGARTDSRCDSQSVNRSAASEPPRSPRHLP